MTVTRSGMNRARSGIERHMVPEQDAHVAILERVLERKPFKHRSGKIRQDRSRGHAKALQTWLEELRGKNEPPCFLATLGFNEHIAIHIAQCDGLIGWKRPGRGRPNDDLDRS